jgi:WD40 repeat protein
MAQQATRIATLEGHSEAVYAVAWSRDGKTLATAGFDNTVRLWDAVTHKNLKTFDGHTKLVLAVAISPDGRRILSGSLDNTAKIWDYPVTGPIKSLDKSSVPLSHSATRPDAKQFVASLGKTVAVFDTTSGKTLFKQKEIPGTATITSTAWSGDGAHVATGDSSGKIRLLKPDLSLDTQIDTTPGSILALQFLPDHKQLVSAHAAGKG